MSDKPNYVDQQMSRVQRLTRNRGFRLLWFVILLFIAAFQVMMFLQLRRQRTPISHSAFEMVLVAALVVVLLLGVVVKSRQNRTL
jgi:cytochrome bd-type quinol oxidase subunit 2